MADQNVPSHRPHDDGRWIDGQHPASDGYHDLRGPSGAGHPAQEYGLHRRPADLHGDHPGGEPVRGGHTDAPWPTPGHHAPGHYGPEQHGPAQPAPGHYGTAQHGAAQHRPAQPAPGHYGTAQHGAAQHRPAQPAPGHYGVARPAPGHYGAARPAPGHYGPGHDGAAHTAPGHPGPGPDPRGRYASGHDAAAPAGRDPYGRDQARRGPQWVGPDGFVPQAPGRPTDPGLPDLDDDDGPGPSNGRRRTLIAVGGGVAAVAAGLAVAGTPQGRDLAGRLFSDPAAADPDPGSGAAGPLTDAMDADTGMPGTGPTGAGQQPSTVRTYTEQNESYMGSRAGTALKKNTPQTGKAFSGPAAAAANTPVTVRTPLAKDPIRHLASRATFGATPKLLADIKAKGIDGWLKEQLDPAKIAPTPAELKLAELPTLTLSIKQLREQREELGKRDAHADQETIDATIARQIWSNRQLFEVMVDFWNDFLHVGPFFDGSDMVRASFDRDVIRRYAFDNYPDMLVAANHHPALLRYLNQDLSSKEKVNENLARENLELYSVGVDGGYTEKDVRQASLLQTGHGIQDDQYVYRPERHHVGPVKIMGFSHPNSTAEGGQKAAEAYFRYLALHPSTARYIALSLATRFVSDTPPKSLVNRLAKSYTTNKGRIRPVLMTLFSSSEFWASVGQKVRRPGEYLVATYRVLGVSPQTPAGYQRGDSKRTPFADGLRQIRSKMEELGHFPTGMPTPNGYPDVFVAWTSAGTMVNSWNEAADVIDGRRAMFTYVKADKLVGKPPATAGAYVDALARRLVHQKLTARERALILGVAGVKAETRVDATFNGAITAVARAILASPHHHLR